MIAFRQAMPAARRTTDRTTFVTLPVVSQIFVVAVSLLGLAALTAAITAFESDRLLLVAALMALTVATSSVKIALPLGRGASNLSLAHTVNFLALFTVGGAPSVCVAAISAAARSEEHTSELQSQSNLVCRLLLEKKKKKTHLKTHIK